MLPSEAAGSVISNRRASVGATEVMSTLRFTFVMPAPVP